MRKTSHLATPPLRIPRRRPPLSQSQRPLERHSMASPVGFPASAVPTRPDGRADFDQTPLAWVPFAVNFKEGPDSSPARVLNILAENPLEVTPSLLEVSRRGFAGRVFSPLARNISKEDASDILHEVEETVKERAKKRRKV